MVRVERIIPILILMFLLSGCISNERNRWVFEVTQIDELHDLGFRGRGIRIGLIDTGVDLKSGDFDGKRFVAWKDLVNGRSSFYDDDGHGTFIAGLLFSKGGFLNRMEGICPECEVVVVKAVSSVGYSNDSMISDAIDFCMDQDVDIILLSLYRDQDYIEIGQRAMERCREAVGRGIIVVAPAGDDGLDDDGDVFDLAGIEGVISVGSIGKSLTISPFSSRGNQAEVLGKHRERKDPYKKPELVAPGEGVESLLLGGGISEMKGTSVSASIVAGSIALLLEAYPGLRGGEKTIEIIKDALAKTARKVGDPSLYSGEVLKHSDLYGYGLIQVYDAYKELGEMI